MPFYCHKMGCHYADFHFIMLIVTMLNVILQNVLTILLRSLVTHPLTNNDNGFYVMVKLVHYGIIHWFHSILMYYMHFCFCFWCFQKFATKFWSHADWYEILKFWTWRCRKMKKPISQLPIANCVVPNSNDKIHQPIWTTTLHLFCLTADWVIPGNTKGGSITFL